MLNSLAAMTLERALAQLLELDPPSRAQARALAGRSLRLTLLPGPLHFCLLFTESGIAVDGHDAGTADTRICMDPAALAAVLEGGTPVTGIRGLEMEGDTGLASEVLGLFRQLRPDLLAPLRQLLGGGPAHAVERAAQRATRTVRTGAREARTAGHKWLTSPNGPLPDPAVVAAQLDEIDELRLATDRLEARIRRLQQRLDGRT